MTPSVALTIAGSDSGGGAGIQADLKTFAALGVFGTSAITAQNTEGVRGIHPVPAEFVVAQVEAVLDDLPVAAVRTGMLATTDVVRAIADLAAAGRLPRLVVDPVMVATSGDRLLDPHPRRATGGRSHPRRPRPSTVVVKGGHAVDEAAGEAIDLVWDGRTVHELRGPRIDTRNNHGTGCTFASATAAALAPGSTVGDAFSTARGLLPVRSPPAPPGDSATDTDHSTTSPR